MKERVYTMTARAATAEQNGTRIIDAMLARFAAMPYDQIRLDDVAEDADVAVQTVIRRFGSKAGLMSATVARELERIVASREQGATSEPVEVLADLVTHYETYGALILKVYAESGMIDGLTQMVADGRTYHLSWCESTFGKHLDPTLGAATRNRRLAQVTAACDATTWRILRIDAGLDVEQTRIAMVEMVTPLLVI